MKISIIGAGNVGGMTALQLAQNRINKIILIDKLLGLAEGKAFDLEDVKALLKLDYDIEGTDDFESIRDSAIIIITAGFPRQPGMTREELLNKNATIVKEIALNIKKFAPESIVIVVTNPLDVMTYLVLKITGFNPKRILGMGIGLDTARFINLISKKLNVSVLDIEACVIGNHGEAMLPLSRFTNIKGIPLEEFLEEKDIEELVKKTVERGKEIVQRLGTGSAYFAPSLAITSLVKAIVKDEKRILGVSAYLDGQYGLKDICIGVPCRIGKEGIEEIIQLELNRKERESFLKSAESIRTQIKSLDINV
ncbi:MAG: malate dehydrogenase [Candidatus Omnitrophica bacterium]|nr:malate dehydrogenase [Candidatus Omnitrophota bacterium]